MKFYPGWPNENDPEDEKGDPTLPYIDGVPVESPQTDIDDEEEISFG